MENKIVRLYGGKTTCRILDTIIENGKTLYFVVDFESGKLYNIDPKNIYDIVDYDENKELKSVVDTIIIYGL